MSILSKISTLINNISTEELSPVRKELLQVLIDYIVKKQGGKVHLNFICTHNSRRSQFAQIWAIIAANYYGINISCYSGGTEVTAFNQRAVESLKRSGLIITRDGNDNPVYSIKYSEDKDAIKAYSKLYDASVNPDSDFAAVMTCSDADADCPFIPGAKQRIPIHYNDPKEFDDRPEEEIMYDKRSRQIASEMFYVFSKINHNK